MNPVHWRIPFRGCFLVSSKNGSQSRMGSHHHSQVYPSSRTEFCRITSLQYRGHFTQKELVGYLLSVISVKNPHQLNVDVLPKEDRMNMS